MKAEKHSQQEIELYQHFHHQRVDSRMKFFSFSLPYVDAKNSTLD